MLKSHSCVRKCSPCNFIFPHHFQRLLTRSASRRWFVLCVFMYLPCISYSFFLSFHFRCYKIVLRTCNVKNENFNEVLELCSKAKNAFIMETYLCETSLYSRFIHSLLSLSLFASALSSLYMYFRGCVKDAFYFATRVRYEMSVLYVRLITSISRSGKTFCCCCCSMDVSCEQKVELIKIQKSVLVTHGSSSDYKMMTSE